MIRFLLLFLLAGCTSLAGSFAPDARLTFPDKPVRVDETGRYFDVNGNGVVDFAVDAESLRYDDDEDGTFDRIYRFADYATDSSERPGRGRNQLGPKWYRPAESGPVRGANVRATGS